MGNETATCEQVGLRADCDCCGGMIMAPGQLPAFYQIKTRLVSVDKAKAGQHFALASFFGQGDPMQPGALALAGVMGPEPDMLTLGEELSIQICMGCWADGKFPLAVMAEAANEATAEGDDGE